MGSPCLHPLYSYAHYLSLDFLLDCKLHGTKLSVLHFIKVINRGSSVPTHTLDILSEFECSPNNQY